MKTPLDSTVFVCDLNLTANLKWVDLLMLFVFYSGLHIDLNGTFHGLRTPNEGINQRYLKNWADVADKICFSRTYQFGIGI